MKIYCQSCAQATEYSSTKPMYCSACAKPFSGALPSMPQAPTVTSTPAAPPKKAKAAVLITPSRIATDDDEDDSDIPTEVPQIDKLDVEIIPPRRNAVQLSDIAGTCENAGSLDRESFPKMSRKKFLEEFRKEAGTRRQK
jgi:hypothetical protein